MRATYCAEYARRSGFRLSANTQQIRELLFQSDPRAGRAIQQPFEVEAGKLIIGALADMRSKGCDCARVARFHLVKGCAGDPGPLGDDGIAQLSAHPRELEPLAELGEQPLLLRKDDWWFTWHSAIIVK